MLNPRSLRFRLAIWYFCTVAAISSLAAGGYWLTVRSALNRARDQGLMYRLVGLRHFLVDLDYRGERTIASKLKEISELGDLYQVYDAGGALIARSSGLERHRIPLRPPRDLPSYRISRKRSTRCSAGSSGRSRASSSLRRMPRTNCARRSL